MSMFENDPEIIKFRRDFPDCDMDIARMCEWYSQNRRDDADDEPEDEARIEEMLRLASRRKGFA